VARRLKVRSNPDLVAAHTAGSVVHLLHPLVHDRHGMIAFGLPSYWAFHFQLGTENAKRLQAVHRRVLALDPGSSKIRAIHDEALLLTAYDAGSAMVSNAVRAVQHLAHEVEVVFATPLRSVTAEDRAREAASLFTDRAVHADPDYQGLAELVAIRDAIEHPKAENTNNPTEWDRVPLAWLLSGRRPAAWQRFDLWFGRLATEWVTVHKSRERTFEVGVRRGIASEHPTKKPPADDRT